MGAFRGHERGWKQVSARLDWPPPTSKATDESIRHAGIKLGNFRI